MFRSLHIIVRDTFAGWQEAKLQKPRHCSLVVSIRACHGDRYWSIHVGDLFKCTVLWWCLFMKILYDAVAQCTYVACHCGWWCLTGRVLTVVSTLQCEGACQYLTVWRCLAGRVLTVVSTLQCEVAWLAGYWQLSVPYSVKVLDWQGTDSCQYLTVWRCLAGRVLAVVSTLQCEGAWLAEYWQLSATYIVLCNAT